jgi:hypothetical protein
MAMCHAKLLARRPGASIAQTIDKLRRSAKGQRVLSGRFVDFFSAAAMTSYVCSTLTPVIPDLSFFRMNGWSWPMPLKYPAFERGGIGANA